MSRRSSIDALPVEVRVALRRKVREMAYGPIDTIHKWIHGEGYELSRSAVGRYIKRMREEDDAMVFDAEGLVLGRVKEASIWEELGALKSREAELLAQLKAVRVRQGHLANAALNPS